MKYACTKLCVVPWNAKSASLTEPKSEDVPAFLVNPSEPFWWFPTLISVDQRAPEHAGTAIICLVVMLSSFDVVTPPLLRAVTR